MKKIDVVEKLAQVREISKKEAGEIVDAFIDIVKTGIKEDGEVDLYGFLKLSRIHKDESAARNVRTGEPIIVPEKEVPKCKFSKSFKDYLND